MAKLSAAQRKKLPSSAFVFPGERAYPIHDLAHACAALRLVGRDTPARQARVRAAVRKRYGANPCATLAKRKGS